MKLLTLPEFSRRSLTADAGRMLARLTRKPILEKRRERRRLLLPRIMPNTLVAWK